LFLSSVTVGVGWSMASVAAWVALSGPDGTVMVFPAWLADALSSAVSVGVDITDDAVAGSWAVTVDSWVAW